MYSLHDARKGQKRGDRGAAGQRSPPLLPFPGITQTRKTPLSHALIHGIGIVQGFDKEYFLKTLLCLEIRFLKMDFIQGGFRTRLREVDIQDRTFF